METGLKGKVALLAGGAGDLGQACAHALAAEGATIAIADHSPAAVERVVEALRAHGGRAHGVVADLTLEHAAGEVIDEVCATLGGLDVLVNCIGVFDATPIADLTLAGWQRVLDINVTGIFLCCQAALRVMTAQGSGRIINFGSLAGQVGGLAAGANYAVSKAGVNCLTKSLARAAGSSGVTVNTINPGPIEGSMVDAWPAGQRAVQESRIPLGRIGRPHEIAGAVVFLASEAASFIHGAHLDINGGLDMD